MHPLDYPEEIRKRPGLGNRVGRCIKPEDSAKLAYQADLEAEICRLIIDEGMTRRQVAAELQINIQRVQHYWTLGFKRAAEHNVPRVEEHVARLNAKLDLEEEDLREMIESYRDAALGGDIDAANVLIKAMAALTAKHIVRARVNGLEAPTKHEIDIKTIPDHDLQSRYAELWSRVYGPSAPPPPMLGSGEEKVETH